MPEVLSPEEMSELLVRQERALARMERLLMRLTGAKASPTQQGRRGSAKPPPELPPDITPEQLRWIERRVKKRIRRMYGVEGQ